MECSELEFKPDWPHSARRLEAWWDCQIVDRAVIKVTAPRDAVTRREIPTPPSLEERWTSVVYVLASAQEQLLATFYGGDAFPCCFPNLGPDIFAGHLGCPIEFGETTSWLVPFIKDWIQAPSLRLDSENKWWKLTLEPTRAAMELAPGRFLVSLTDLHGGLDPVAALRDPQNPALDVVDHPDQVKQAVDALIPIWFEVYEGMRQLINPRSPGTTTWLSVWTAGKSYPVSRDFIFMISPAMFRDFVLKDLLAETDWLDRSIFHRDGPGALKQPDALLAIPRIQAIQWVPGEKIPRQPITTWIPCSRESNARGRRST